MKKILFFIAVAAGVMFSACTGCNNGSKGDAPADSTDTINDSVLVVETLISADRAYMADSLSENYRWYETCILFKDFLDSDDFDGTIESVSNVFQFVEEKEGGFDSKVVQTSHCLDTATVQIIEGLWVEDWDMSTDSIKITFAEALKAVQESNFKKPHSRHCVLRNQVGPKTKAPQYIFGNTKRQIYVDAVTGEITDKNPVFGAPLGEWP